MRLVLVAALATMTVAAPLNEVQPVAEIIEYRNERDGLGGYHFAYRTSDGIYREETGELKNPGTDQEHMEVRGSTTWTGPDGLVYKLSFVANQEGYVAQVHPPRTPEQRPSPTTPGTPRFTTRPTRPTTRRPPATHRPPSTTSTPAYCSPGVLKHMGGGLMLKTCLSLIG